MSSPGCRKLVQRWKTKHRYWSSRLRLLITSFTQTFWTSSMTMKLIFFSINRSIWWTCSKITWIMVLILRGKNVSRPCNRYCFTFYRLPCSNNKIVYTLSSNEFLSPLKSSFTPVTISAEGEGRSFSFHPLPAAFFPHYLLLSKANQSRFAPVCMIYALIKCICVVLC